jgi:hypothetical protein
MKTQGQGTVPHFIFIPLGATSRVALSFLLISAFCLLADAPAAAAPKKKQEREPNALERVGNFFYRISRKLEQPSLSSRSREREPVVVYESRRALPSPPHEVYRYEGSGTGLTVPPGYRGGNVYYDYPPPPGVTARVYPPRPQGPPVYQTYPPPHLRYPERVESPDSTLTVPAPDEGEVARPDAASPPPPNGSARPEAPALNPGAPFDPPVNSAPQTKARARTNDNASRSSSGESSPAPDSAPSQPAASTAKADPEFATPVPGKPGFVYPPGVEQTSRNMLDVRDFSPAQKVKDPRSGKVFLVPPQ